MNFFTPAAEVRPHLKAMFMGDFDTGKTFNTFFFPFPLAGFEVESGLQAYLDRVKFDMKKIYRIQELNDGLQMLTETDEGKAYLGNYRTIAIDGISKLWHDEMKRLRGDRDSLEFEDMSELKSPWKVLNSYVKTLGLLDLNVIATAHSKTKWEVPENGGAPRPVGVRGDFDGRMFEAFDLVGVAQVRKDEDGKDHYDMLIVRSRYGHLVRGETIRDWDPAEQFSRILNIPKEELIQPGIRAEYERARAVVTGGSAPAPRRASRPAAEPTPEVKPETLVSAASNAAVTPAQKQEIESICKQNGSQSKGGILEDSLVREAVSFLKGNGTQAEADALLERLRAAVDAAQTADV